MTHKAARFHSPGEKSGLRVAPPLSVRYSPPESVVRPRQKVAAAWFDRMVTEAFPMVVPKGGEHPKPVVPGPGAPIVIGGVELNVGAGGMHSADRPALHRTNAEMWSTRPTSHRSIPA